MNNDDFLLATIEYASESIRDVMRMENVEISEEAVEVFIKYHVTAMMGVIEAKKSMMDLEKGSYGSEEEKIIN